MATLIITMLLVGPPTEQIKVPIKVLIDSKSKDDIVKYRSNCAKEIFIKDDRWFPAQQYFIHNYFNVELIEYEDHQWTKVPKVPAFKFGKNGAWQEFCPGTFAGPGMFTLSIFSLGKWYKFDEEYAQFKTIKRRGDDYQEKESLPIIPECFPPESSGFYGRLKFLDNILSTEYNSSYYNIYKFDNQTTLNFTFSLKDDDFDKVDK